MSALEQFRKSFDSSSWDYNDRDEIEKQLRTIRNDADKSNNKVLALEAQRELEIFCFNKSMKDGLTSMSSGTQIDKEGNEIPFSWPDINSFSEDDWKMVETRYKETNNYYGKYEYGMLLFLGNKKKDNSFVVELLQNMKSLLDIYYSKAVDDDKNKTHYSNYFLYLLKNVFSLSASRKKANADIANVFETIKKLAYDVLLKTDTQSKSSPMITMRLTNTIVENYAEFSPSVDIDLILLKNREVVEVQKESNGHSAIAVAEIADKLATKAGKDKIFWHRAIAETYELIANKRGGMVAPEFLMKAMRHYKIIRDEKKLKEIHSQFSKSKKNLDFGRVSHKLPDEVSKILYEALLNEIASLTPEEIIGVLATGIKFPRFSAIKKSDDENTEMSLFKMVTTLTFDKHGNKNFASNPSSESDSSYYNSYSLAFQIPAKSNFQFFIESIKAGKVTYVEIDKWFSKSWIGQEFIRIYNGYSSTVIPYDLLRPGIKLLMQEFERFLSPGRENPTEGDIPDLICGIDSLAPKIEYLFRILMEEQLGLPTTRIKEDGTWEEKMLTELINDLRDFVNANSDPEAAAQINDDLSFIDFVMNHKAGMNIRNCVAHAHYDKDEYTGMRAMLVLSVLLRISVWTFTTITKPETPVN